jgi:hypothetical protein
MTEGATNTNETDYEKSFVRGIGGAGLIVLRME